MTKIYRQELRPTSKEKEFQMVYVEETLSPELEAEILAIKNAPKEE